MKMISVATVMTMMKMINVAPVMMVANKDNGFEGKTWQDSLTHLPQQHPDPAQEAE